MAFVRRKGNTFYLVHNVRHGGKVRQLHLARLGKPRENHGSGSTRSFEEASLHRSKLAFSARTVEWSVGSRRSRLPGSTKPGIESAIAESGFGGFVSAAVANF